MDIGSSVGQYRVLGRLGAGGMGEVYRAHDAKLGRDVALKVLPADVARDPASVERLRVEARLLASINHPNIVSIYDLVEEDDRVVLVLELVTGSSLDDTLSSSHRLRVTDAMQIGRQVASALEVAHGSGIIHRDLKPSNIIVADDGTAKVLDFGIAYRAGVTAQDDEPETVSLPDLDDLDDFDRRVVSKVTAQLTHAGVIVGTVPYMSPEQVSGAPLDRRTDIWSLGCLLFELLTGEPPFSRRSLPATLAAILTQEPDWDLLPAKTPPQLASVIRRCLRKDPGSRVHEVADLRIELEELLADDRSPTFRSSRSSRRAWVGALIAAGLASFALDMGGVRTRLFEGDSLTGISALIVLPTEVTSGGSRPNDLFGAESTDPDVTYLTDAIPASLTHALATLEGVDIPAAPTSAELASIDGNLTVLTELFGTPVYLATALELGPDSMSLLAELFEFRNPNALWRGEYERARADHSGLVLALSNDLAASLRPDGPELEPRALGSNSAAERLLRRGQFFAAQFRAYQEPQDLQLASAALNQAIEEDDDLAAAAAELALLDGVRLQLGLGDAQAVTSMGQWAERATSLDPDDGLAWTAQAAFESLLPGADTSASRLRASLRAATLAPREARAHSILGQTLSVFSMSLGVEAFRQATQARPLLYPARINHVASLTSAGRLDDALIAITEAAVISSSDEWATIMTEGSILSQRRRTVEAKRILDQLESLVSSGVLPGPILTELRLEFALATGDEERAEEVGRDLDNLLAAPAVPRQLLWNLVVSATSAYSAAGRLDRAFHVLELGSARDVLIPYDYLALNERLALLRADPRYAAVAEPSQRRFDAMMSILDQEADDDSLPTYLGPAIAALRMRMSGI